MSDSTDKKKSEINKLAWEIKSNKDLSESEIEYKKYLLVDGLLGIMYIDKISFKDFQAENFKEDRALISCIGYKLFSTALLRDAINEVFENLKENENFCAHVVNNYRLKMPDVWKEKEIEKTGFEKELKQSFIRRTNKYRASKKGVSKADFESGNIDISAPGQQRRNEPTVVSTKSAVPADEQPVSDVSAETDLASYIGDGITLKNICLAVENLYKNIEETGLNEDYIKVYITAFYGKWGIDAVEVKRSLSQYIDASLERKINMEKDFNHDANLYEILGPFMKLSGKTSKDIGNNAYQHMNEVRKFFEQYLKETLEC